MNGTGLRWLAGAGFLAVLMLGTNWAWCADAGAVADWEKELDAKLSEPVTVQFDGTDLPKAMAFFRQRAKVNVILDMGKPSRPGTEIVPRVTLSLEGVQAESALAWTVRLAGYSYVVRDQAIYVAPDYLIDPEWRQAMRARYARRMSDLKTGWMKQIEARMQSKIDVQYHGDPIDRAAADLASRAGLNIVVDPDSAKTAKLVTFEANQMVVENVLKWMTQVSGVRYVVRDEVVYIGTPTNMARLQLETGTSGVPAKFLETVTFDFKGTELMQALKNLQQRSGVTIEVTEPPKTEHKVTARGEKVELDRAVRIVLDQAGVGYAVSYRGDTMVVIVREKSDKKP